jgi:hypothetical protein
MRRERIRRFGVLAAALTCIAGLVGLVDAGRAGGQGMSSAQAQAGGTPFEVGSFGCLVNRGQRTVPAGSMIVIRNGWSVFGSRGSIGSFLAAQVSVLSVNDGPMIDVSGEYGPAELSGTDTWTTWLRHSSGVTLDNPGDSMRFTFTLVFKRPVTDVSDLDGDGSADPVNGSGGLAFGGTCTVTAQ